jgi:Zn-dependent alcohol dehydrogenase
MSNGEQLLPRLLSMVQSGSFPVNLLSKVYPAKDINQAIADMESGKESCDLATALAKSDDQLQVINLVLAW